MIDSTARRWVSSSRPSTPSALRSSASRISSACARSDAIAGTTSSDACHSWNFSASVGDDRLGALRLAAAAGKRLGHDRLEIVDVVEVAAVELVDRRVEIARDGEVDEEQLPPACARARPSPRRGRSRARSSTRRRRRRARAPPRARARSVLLFAVERRCSRPARAQVARRLLADLAGADQQDRAAVEVAEHLLGERGGRRRDRRGALADRRLRTHLAARVQRLPEDTVEQQPGRARVVARRAPGRESRPRPGTSESSPAATRKRWSAAAWSRSR